VTAAPGSPSGFPSAGGGGGGGGLPGGPPGGGLPGRPPGGGGGGGLPGGPPGGGLPGRPSGGGGGGAQPKVTPDRTPAMGGSASRSDTTPGGAPGGTGAQPPERPQPKGPNAKDPNARDPKDPNAKDPKDPNAKDPQDPADGSDQDAHKGRQSAGVGAAVKGAAKEGMDNRSSTDKLAEARQRQQQGEDNAVAKQAAIEGSKKIGQGIGAAFGASELGKRIGGAVGALLIGLIPLVVTIMGLVLIFGAVLGLSYSGPNQDHPKTEENVQADAITSFKRAGNVYGVPWTVIAAISQLATENGKFSPYPSDTIDRNPERAGLRRPSAGSTASFTSTGTALVIGDSLCEPGPAQDQLRDAMARKGWGSQIDCVRGRPTAPAAGLLNGRPDVPGTVVVALGTNDAGTLAAPGAGTDAYGVMIDEVMATVPGKQVRWVNVATDQAGAAAVNAAITAAGERHANLSVVDFAAVVRNERSLLAGDGIHLTVEGYTRRGETIAAALGSGGAVSAANPPGIEVSDFPVVTPGIGTDDDRAQGPFLILTSAVNESGIDAQDYTSTASNDRSDPDTATDWVASELNRIRDDLVNNGDFDFDPGDPESHSELWREVVSRMDIIDPGQLACSWSGGPVGDQSQIGAAIQVLWRCELTGAKNLYTLTGGPDSDALARSAAVQTVLNEASQVSYAFSGWAVDAACSAALGDQPAGVFPLTQEIFDRYATDVTRASGRCDPVANISAAAAAFVAGESVKPGSRSDDRLGNLGDRSDGPGKFNPMIGGWWAMPWALGDDAARQTLLDDGPGRWLPSEGCTKAIDKWLVSSVGAAEAFRALTPATVAAQRTDLDAAAVVLGLDDVATNASCSAATGGALENAIAIEANALAAEFTSDGGSDVLRALWKAVDGLRGGGNELSAEESAVRLRGLATYFTVVAAEAQRDVAAAQVLGVSTIVNRLSPTSLIVSPPAMGPTGVVPYAKRVVDFAVAIGGLFPNDERFDPSKDPYALLSSTSLAVGGTIPGVGPIVMDAYFRAAANIGTLYPGCQVPVALLAAFGKVESGHAVAYGGVVQPDGSVVPRIIGPALDGRPGFMLIRDTDGGLWDDDTIYDRAVGVTQFIPTTWATQGRDGNGDGVNDPHNVYDGAMSTASEVCRGTNSNPADPEALRRMIYGYNRSWTYVDTILRYFDEYSAILAVMGSSVAIGEFALPLERSWFERRPDFLTAPHHTYPAADLGGPEGTPIFSASSGRVVAVTPVSGGCGNGVIVDTADGWRFTYCHFVQPPMVASGQELTPGQQIGLMGTTGNSTGNHLHFAVARVGAEWRKLCPQPLMQAWFDGIPRAPTDDLNRECPAGQPGVQ
jgi:hypothetical protein